MAQSAPGKHYREGITLFELQQIFPDEAAAQEWFEDIIWPDGTRHCPNCGSVNTHECSHDKMPYRCRDCRKYFSIKTGTVMAGSPLPLLKWVYAIYLDVTSLKDVSSMKLKRDLGITQKTAWFMQQRIREAFAHQDVGSFLAGPAEDGETYIGGKRKNMHKAKRKEREGRGPVDMTAVVGVKDRETKEVRAKVVEHTDGPTLQGFVREHVQPGATVYTDEAGGYKGLGRDYTHEAVNHSVGEHIREMAGINGMESFWAGFKREFHGTFHKISSKHLQRYINEFAVKHNIREMDTLRQMAIVALGMSGKFLPYDELIADNGLDSYARS